MTSSTSNTKTVRVAKIPKQFYNAQETTDKIGAVPKYTIRKKGYKKLVRLVASAVVGGIIATTSCAVFASGFSLGYTVEMDNKTVGTVASKNDFYEALDDVKEEAKIIADVDFEPSSGASFHMEIVKKSELTEKSELAENIKSMSEDMTECFCITLNGEFVAAAESEIAANEVLEAYLAERIGENENITAEFTQAVEVTKMHVPNGSAETKEAILDLLDAGKYVMHEVAEGETLATIAMQYETTTEEIAAANGLETNEVIFGRVLKIYTGEPFFSVKTVEHIIGEFEIPYETQKKEDNTLYRGRTEIDVMGKAGSVYRDCYITKIDGAVVEEQVISDEILSEPVTQIERVGTKEAPPSVGTGAFVMPTSGTLTSPFGARWGRTHAGIDVGAKTGTPIYAADNGIVTESQYKNNGYGNFISIDHGNGYVTYYAHCSELLVSAGDVVAKGDLIAKVGSTGRSTGPHLHFEVRLNGEAQNPMHYVK